MGNKKNYLMLILLLGLVVLSSIFTRFLSSNVMFAILAVVTFSVFYHKKQKMWALFACILSLHYLFNLVLPDNIVRYVSLIVLVILGIAMITSYKTNGKNWCVVLGSYMFWYSIYILICELLLRNRGILHPILFLLMMAMFLLTIYYHKFMKWQLNLAILLIVIAILKFVGLYFNLFFAFNLMAYFPGILIALVVFLLIVRD